MLHIKNTMFILLFSLLIHGCVTKEYTKEESIFIVFKTPTFKHADLGFIYIGEEVLKVEIYGSGQVVMALEIDKENICISLFECMEKTRFNKKVLSRHYPRNILEHIFRGEVIFEGLQKVKMRNGFTQHLSKTNKYNIEYSVLNKQILFRDTMNDIVIKIKRV